MNQLLRDIFTRLNQKKFNLAIDCLLISASNSSLMIQLLCILFVYLCMTIYGHGSHLREGIFEETLGVILIVNFI